LWLKGKKPSWKLGPFTSQLVHAGVLPLDAVCIILLPSRKRGEPSTHDRWHEQCRSEALYTSERRIARRVPRPAVRMRDKFGDFGALMCGSGTHGYRGHSKPSVGGNAHCKARLMGEFQRKAVWKRCHGAYWLGLHIQDAASSGHQRRCKRSMIAHQSPAVKMGSGVVV
jgi:hypothetical protein